MNQPEQPGSESPQFITRASLARRWSASVSTVRRHEAAGRLHPRREIGSNVRYALAEVLAIEQQGEPSSTR